MKIKTENFKIKDYKIDFIICNNLYYTSDIKKVKNNLKNFNIKVRFGKFNEKIGIRFTKIHNNVIATIHIINEQFEMCNQFLVNDKTNIYDFLMIKEIEAYHEILIDAVNIVKTDSIDELKKIFADDDISIDNVVLFIPANPKNNN